MNIKIIDWIKSATSKADNAQATADAALPKAGGTISGNLTVSGATALSDNAIAGGKHIVRSINGVEANGAGIANVTTDPSGITFCTFTNIYGNALKVSFIASGADVTMPEGGSWTHFFWYDNGSGDLNASYAELAGGTVWTNTSSKTIVALSIRTA